MDILKRLQDADPSQDASDFDEDMEAEPDEGAEQSTGDLGVLSEEQLLDLLTADERATFHRMLQDPESSQRLFEALERDKQTEAGDGPSAPWWISPSETTVNAPIQTLLEGRPDDTKRFLDDTAQCKAQLQATQPAQNLTYNFVAVLFSYAFLVRQLGTHDWIGTLDTRPSPSSSRLSATARETSWEMLSRLTPFLTVALSAAGRPTAHEMPELVAYTVLQGVEDVTLWVLSRLTPAETGVLPAKILLMLVQDVQSMLAPDKVVAVEMDAVYAGKEKPVWRAALDIWLAVGHMPEAAAKSDQAIRLAHKKLAQIWRRKWVFYFAQYLVRAEKEEAADAADNAAPRRWRTLLEELERERTRLAKEIERDAFEDAVRAKDNFEQGRTGSKIVLPQIDGEVAASRAQPPAALVGETHERPLVEELSPDEAVTQPFSTEIPPAPCDPVPQPTLHAPQDQKHAPPIPPTAPEEPPAPDSAIATKSAVAAQKNALSFQELKKQRSARR